MAYPNCKHRSSSSCNLGLYGGKPTGVECNGCDQNRGRPRGLGDVIHKAAELTGLDKLAPDGCGCSGRRDRLNNLGKNSRLTADPADTGIQP